MGWTGILQVSTFEWLGGTLKLFTLPVDRTKRAKNLTCLSSFVGELNPLGDATILQNKPTSAQRWSTKVCASLSLCPCRLRLPFLLNRRAVQSYSCSQPLSLALSLISSRQLHTHCGLRRSYAPDLRKSRVSCLQADSLHTWTEHNVKLNSFVNLSIMTTRSGQLILEIYNIRTGATGYVINLNVHYICKLYS